MKVKTNLKAGDHCNVAWQNVKNTLNQFGQACSGDPHECLR
jgi:hypothetical protein